MIRDQKEEQVKQFQQGARYDPRKPVENGGAPVRREAHLFGTTRGLA